MFPSPYGVTVIKSYFPYPIPSDQKIVSVPLWGNGN